MARECVCVCVCACVQERDRERRLRDLCLAQPSSPPRRYLLAWRKKDIYVFNSKQRCREARMLPGIYFRFAYLCKLCACVHGKKGFHLESDQSVKANEENSSVK